MLPDWMDQRHFEACAASDLFAHLDDFFVGTPAQVRTLTLALTLTLTLTLHPHPHPLPLPSPDPNPRTLM